MEEECMICALPLSEGYCITTSCDTPHKFHYECLMKSCLNDQIWKASYQNRCPYCRGEIGYLPIVNGIKRIHPKIHYSEDSDTTPDISQFQTRCQHKLERGKRKGECCLKNSLLGFSYCKSHFQKYTQEDSSNMTYYINE